MKAEIKWEEGMKFHAEVGKNSITLDAKSPIGKDQGLTPKELLPISIAGCTGMDVVAFMRKKRVVMDSFNMRVEVNKTESGYPQVFTDATIYFEATGENIPKDALIEAVTLSQTKYCGVSAMLSKAFPIYYKIILNNNLIGEGKADF